MREFALAIGLCALWLTTYASHRLGLHDYLISLGCKYIGWGVYEAPPGGM